MKLSTIQAEQFRKDGYLQLSGLVPPSMVASALRTINHQLGEGIDPAKLLQFRSQTYVPEITSSAAIADTYNCTGLHELFEELLGVSMEPQRGAQIALRFPSLDDSPTQHSPHLDGTYSPTNGVAEGKIESFTALCHVLLSDLPDPKCGNFTVWPGTHHRYAAHFCEHGYKSLVNGTPTIDIPEPVQIIGRAGDVVIAHYLLGHGLGSHVGSHIRYGLFFRVKHPNHMDHQEQALTDPMFEWPGLGGTTTP